MLLRVALALTCSIAALRYAQRRRDHGLRYQHINVADSVSTTRRSSAEFNESAPKIQEEENKKQSLSSVLLLDFDELSVGQMGLPISSENLEKEDSAAKLKNVRDAVIDSKEYEVEHLKKIVTAIREKEMKARSHLLGVGPLKELLKGHVDLESQLTEKDSQIKFLRSQITSLEAYTTKARQELSGKQTLEQELQMARIKIRELQRDRRNDASYRQTQLQLMKQHLSKLQEIQEQNSRKETEHQKNLLVLKDLEAEVDELKQGIKKMSQDSQTLTIAAEKRIAEVSIITKSEPQRNRENDSSQLLRENIDLKKLVEEEQASRFRDVEEVVYLRWVNACLQYELDMQKASCQTPTASDYDETNSPASEQKLKQGSPRRTRPVLIPLNVKDESANTPEIVFSPSARPPVIGNASMSHSAPETPAVKISPRKQQPGKILLRSSSSLSTDSEASNRSPKSRRPSLEMQEINENLVRSSSSLSSDSEIYNISPKQRRNSSSVLESYLRRNAGEAETGDFNRVTSRFSPSASFGRRSDLAKSSPVSTRKGLLRQQSESGIESYTNKNDASERVASSFQILSAANCTSGKHLAFKDLRKLTSVAEEARAGNPAEILSAGHGSHSESMGSSPIASPTLPSSPSDGTRAHAKIRQRSNSSTLRLDDNCQSQIASQDVEIAPQSLMPNNAQTVISNPVSKEKAKIASAHIQTIKEIEDGSMFFLAVKEDVFTKGDFVQYLATKIRDAEFSEIEDVVAFVKWIDRELLLLVDERAVVKHFDWPENIIDALREAAFHFQDMKKLEAEINSYEPRPNTPGDVALKSMLELQEKTEDYVNTFLQSRDLAVVRYKSFNIPTYWMLDSGLLGKIKLATVQLAQKYMKRVLLELEHFRDIPAEKSSRDGLLVQAARFAFTAHQFAGGFDFETLSTFKDLKNKGDSNFSKEQPTSLEGCA